LQKLSQKTVSTGLGQEGALRDNGARQQGVDQAEDLQFVVTGRWQVGNER